MLTDAILILQLLIIANAVASTVCIVLTVEMLRVAAQLNQEVQHANELFLSNISNNVG